MEIRRSTNYDPGADIRGANKGQFKADLAFGSAGEDQAESIVRALLEGWVEVKSDGFENGNLFIEVAQGIRGSSSDLDEIVWKKSGLNVTQAKYYMYIKQSESGVLRSATIFETDRLRKFHRWVKDTRGMNINEPGFKGTGYMYGNINGEVPTIGLRITKDYVEILRSSSQFD